MNPYFTEEDLRFDDEIRASFDSITKRLIEKDGPVRAVARISFLVADFADDVAYAIPAKQEA